MTQLFWVRLGAPVLRAVSQFATAPCPNGDDIPAGAQYGGTKGSKRLDCRAHGLPARQSQRGSW